MCPHISPPFAAQSVIICTHTHTEQKRSQVLSCAPVPLLSRPLSAHLPLASTRLGSAPSETRRKCVHKTISLCRHYPEEFWFVLVTRSAINHSHAWHISSRHLTHSLSLFPSACPFPPWLCYAASCCLARTCNYSLTLRSVPRTRFVFHVLFRDFSFLLFFFFFFAFSVAVRGCAYPVNGGSECRLWNWETLKS